MISAQSMNYDPREALQRFYAGQSVAMDTFRNQTQAAQANALMGYLNQFYSSAKPFGL